MTTPHEATGPREVTGLPLEDLYGLLAEFDQPEDVVAAANLAREAGYRVMEAYTPIPVADLTEALGHKTTKLPYITLTGGVLGAIGGYALQYWTTVINYPLNIGGRPLHSWPAFAPVVFEMTVLGAALFSVFGMLALNGLPMPYHPVFNVPQFKLASRDKFFLMILTRDPNFDRDKVQALMETMHGATIHEVPR